MDLDEIELKIPAPKPGRIFKQGMSGMNGLAGINNMNLDQSYGLES
jgi:hypothetical protein